MFFFSRAMAQGNTLTPRTAVAIAPGVSACDDDANYDLSGARLTGERLRWLPIGEAFAFGARDDQARTLAIRDFAAVVAEREFVAVASEMALADVMKRPDDTALQQPEESFDGVRVNLATDVHAVAVLDRA